MVVILDRPRHEEQIARIRAHGGRIRLIPDGDVAGSLMARRPDIGVDLLWGIGGTPEGVLVRGGDQVAPGGALLGRMWPRDDDERARTVAAGIDPDRMLDADDLIAGRQLLLCGDRRDGRRYPQGRAVHLRGGVHDVHRDALAFRHRPHRRGAPSPRPAAGADLMLIASLAALALVAPQPTIVQSPIPYGPTRRAQMAAYSKRHYGTSSSKLRPRVIVLHFTANNSYSATWNTFASNAPNRARSRARARTS